MLYSTILCATDFSDQSRRALRLGLTLAAAQAPRQPSRVFAAHVLNPLLAEAAAGRSGPARLKSDTTAELHALIEAERAAITGAPDVSPIVRVGPPAREILASADEVHAALIVMGTQGLGGLRKLFFGSVAEKVLGDAHVPVLAVPSPEEPGPAAVPTIQRVIASVELGHSGEIVVKHAAAFATAFGLPLELLHVVAPIDGIPRAVEAARAAERQHESHAQTRLSDLAGLLPPGMTAQIAIRSGPAAEQIAAAAAADDAIVVIASGGDSGRHRPGATAYRILCLSDAPVLAIPLKAASGA